MTNEAGSASESFVTLDQRDQLWLERGIRIGKWLGALIERLRRFKLSTFRSN